MIKWQTGAEKAREKTLKIFWWGKGEARPGNGEMRQPRAGFSLIVKKKAASEYDMSEWLGRQDIRYSPFPVKSRHGRGFACYFVGRGALLDLDQGVDDRAPPHRSRLDTNIHSCGGRQPENGLQSPQDENGKTSSHENTFPLAKSLRSRHRHGRVVDFTQ